jgi:hypothetical protein
MEREAGVMGERRHAIKRERKPGNTLSQWNVEYIAAEQNIESIGYFSATYSRRSITDTRASKVITFADNRKIEILPSTKYGLPNAEDLDFYRAFLKICHERVRLVKVESGARVVYHPELPVPIGFSSREITVKANKKWSGRTNKAVREWIERLNATTIHGAIFSAKEQRYDVGIGLEPLFRQYVHVGHVMTDGQFAPQNFVWPAQWFIDNYYHLYTRPIDLKFHHRLTCSIAKALYPLLDSGWFASNGSPYTKRYTDLCTVLDIQVYKQLSRVQQQLDPSQNELVHEKFLASYDYPLDEHGQWTGTIRWWPGPKWLYDQEKRGRRKQVSDDPPSLIESYNVNNQELEPMPAQMELRLPAHRAIEGPELYENRVRQFYTTLGQVRVSHTKIHAGTAIIRHLVEEEDFSLHDVDYTLEWIVKNLHTRFGGAVKSLGLLPHVIGEALQEKAHRDRAQRRRARVVNERQEEPQSTHWKVLEEHLAALSQVEQQELRQKAIQSLARQGVKLEFMRDTVIKSEMGVLLETG